MQLHAAIQAAKGETEKRGINQKSIVPTIHRQDLGGVSGSRKAEESDNSYLHKAQWQECHVVGTEEGIE